MEADQPTNPYAAPVAEAKAKSFSIAFDLFVPFLYIPIFAIATGYGHELAFRLLFPYRKNQGWIRLESVVQMVSANARVFALPSIVIWILGQALCRSRNVLTLLPRPIATGLLFGHLMTSVELFVRRSVANGAPIMMIASVLAVGLTALAFDIGLGRILVGKNPLGRWWGS